MLCKRRAFIGISIVMAFVMCTVNLHLLSRHHKLLPSEEIFLTHFNTNTSKRPSSSRQVDKPDNNSDPKIFGSVYTSSCFRPSQKIVLQPNTTLPFPVINLGFPKMGTSSIHAFFGCAGYRSMHFRCNKSYACAECLRKQSLQYVRAKNQGEMVGKKTVNLKECGIADVYSQIDRDDYFPQMSNLKEILAGHPNATYFLTFRTMEKWYHSISNWPPDVPDDFLLKNRLFAPGLKRHGNLTDYAKWFCNHVKRVRNLIQQYPQATLVEIDIEDNVGTAEYMSDLFNVDENCWGRANVNFDLHSHLEKTDEDMDNTKEEKSDVKAQGSMPWFIQGKNMIRGKNGVMRPKYDPAGLPPHIAAMLAQMKGNLTTSSTDRSIESNETHDLKLENPMRQKSSLNMPLLPPRKLLSGDDYCNALLAHEKGHWEEALQEEFPEFVKDNPSMRNQLFPKEKEWLKGKNPWYGYGQCKREKNVLMYNTILGHQCGCGVRGFAPSLPQWKYDNIHHPAIIGSLMSESGFHSSWLEFYQTSATLRLVRKLAQTNTTLCFAGDSIDYQIYYGMQNNLKRASQLHSMHFSGSPDLINVMDRLIPVKYSTEPGTIDDWYMTGKRPPDGDGSFVNGTRPPPGGFGSMHSILETKAWFKGADENSSGKLALIRFFMTYGWSPWNIEHMEDCNIVVMNLGLHYMPTGNHTGKQTRRPLVDDLRAAFTYLVNFTSANDDRVAIWRSALPQHFDTSDGHFHGWDNLPENHSCTDLKEKRVETKQVYNRVYDELLSSMCREPTKSPQQCSRLEHVCNVDTMSLEYPTIFKYWMDNNCTGRIEREEKRLGTSNVTGTILRWDIFDLFDKTLWHSKDMDCTHHCYVPALYDNAFERLELLVMSKFKD